MEIVRFILANQFITAAILMVIVVFATVMVDMILHGATAVELWTTIRRDKPSATIMLVVCYACCELLVSLASHGLQFVFPHA